MWKNCCIYQEFDLSYKDLDIFSRNIPVIKWIRHTLWMGEQEYWELELD